jgi:hypothetical protein
MARVEKGELIPNLLSPAGLACQGSPPALSRRICVHAVLKQMGSGQRSSWFHGRCGQIYVDSQASLPRSLACSHYLESLRTTLHTINDKTCGVHLSWPTATPSYAAGRTERRPVHKRLRTTCSGTAAPVMPGCGGGAGTARPRLPDAPVRAC